MTSAPTVNAMTNEEVKTAFLNRTPVLFGDNEYLFISAIVYRLDENGNVKVSAELLDKNKRSVVIAQVKDVTISDKQNQRTNFVS